MLYLIISVKEANQQFINLHNNISVIEYNDTEFSPSKDIQDNVRLPNFNALLKLKIDFMERNQIIVKNCTTDTFFEFNVDISKLPDANDLIQPVFTKTSPNVYKYTYLINNETLPEQLCTILPKVSSKIMLSSSPNNFELTTIPEVLHTESKAITLYSDKLINHMLDTKELQRKINYKENKVLKFNRCLEIKFILSGIIEKNHLICYQRNRLFPILSNIEYFYKQNLIEKNMTLNSIPISLNMCLKFDFKNSYNKGSFYVSKNHFNIGYSTHKNLHSYATDIDKYCTTTKKIIGNVNFLKDNIISLFSDNGHLDNNCLLVLMPIHNCKCDCEKRILEFNTLKLNISKNFVHQLKLNCIKDLCT